MEVVSTSNLVSSETKKTTTACNFQTMNSFVKSHDLMRDQIRSHVNERFLMRIFMMAELKKRRKKTYVNKTARSKLTSNELKKKCFTLKMHYLL